MCGSGAKTGTKLIKIANSLYITPLARLPAPTASFAVGRGTTNPPIVAQLTAAPRTRAFGTTIWVFGWPGRIDLISFLLFYLL